MGKHKLTSVTRYVCMAIIQEEARIHYGCPSLDGVELENQGGRRTMLSHWEKRIFGVRFLAMNTDRCKMFAIL